MAIYSLTGPTAILISTPIAFQFYILIVLIINMRLYSHQPQDGIQYKSTAIQDHKKLLHIEKIHHHRQRPTSPI